MNIRCNSDVLSLLGKCDCIEAVRAEDGCRIPALEFPVKLYPVEYKHGSLREEESYQLQLCAQAMCLEEMFHTTIEEGALFFISSHRRLPVLLDEALREQVRQRRRRCTRCGKHFRSRRRSIAPSVNDVPAGGLYAESETVGWCLL